LAWVVLQKSERKSALWPHGSVNGGKQGRNNQPAPSPPPVSEEGKIFPFSSIERAIFPMPWRATPSGQGKRHKLAEIKEIFFKKKTGLLWHVRCSL
jgi:hypothetical protein